MSNSLQDQLLKAGLINKKQAQSAKKTKHKQKIKVAPGQLSDADIAKQEAAKQREAKAEKDRQLNLQRQQAAEEKALQAQIRQIIEMNRLTDTDGDVAYNFTDDRKIKRLHVTEALWDGLSRGQLAIAKLDDNYLLIPAQAAEKIKQRNSDAIIQLNERQAEETDEDDPYAAYQIPDDLMW